ncbi:MAG: hypothetical protein AAGC64_02780 [Bacteroidota bacterium]
MNANPFEQLQHHNSERFSLLEGKIDGVSQMLQNLINSKEYSVIDIAERTNTTPQTVRKLLKENDIQIRRFGRKFIVSHEQFEKACELVKTKKYKR